MAACVPDVLLDGQHLAFVGDGPDRVLVSVWTLEQAALKNQKVHKRLTTNLTKRLKKITCRLSHLNNIK